MWKLCAADLSWTTSLIEPGFRAVTFLPVELTIVMVKPGPTLPVYVGVVAPLAWPASAAAISAATAPMVMRFLMRLLSLGLLGVRSQVRTRIAMGSTPAASFLFRCGDRF